MKIDIPPSQHVAQPADWKRLADITAEAFADDPVNLYTFGTARAVKSAMRVMARDVYLRHGMCFLHGDQGATMWVRPNEAAPIGTLALIRFASGMARHGSKGAAKRAIDLGKLMEKNHPTEPHMYLFTIGTTQAARGQGVGKALMAPVLSACDHDGVPVYLENSNPANHGFYTAHGFERITEFNVGEDGPPMSPMWREPRSGS